MQSNVQAHGAITTRHTFCRICEAACGLSVDINDQGAVVAIAPNEQHIASTGYACLKGLKAHEFRDSPDRITQPMKRVNGELVAISWAQALSEIGGALKRIHGAHGGDAIGLYLGNPISMSFLPPLLSTAFVKAFGSSKLYHTGSQDCNNKFVVAERMYGCAQIQPFPDIDHSQFIIAVGSNPVVSKMSFISMPHSGKRFKALVARGARVIWLNPRRTETAKQVGEHHFIRPDTDVFFMLAFLQALIESGAIDEVRVREHMTGWDTVKALVAPWTAERVAPVTGVPATTLRDWVQAYAAADGAALYSSTGVNQGSHGSLAFWLQEVINAVSGNLDKRGGTLVGKGIVDVSKLNRFDPDKPLAMFRLGEVPLVMDTVPAGVLADDILTPGAGQLKALFVTAGNPLLTCPNSHRLTEAFRQLELLVAIDLHESETARHAHYVLPGSHWLERADIPFTFNTMMGTTPIPYHQYTDAVLPLKGDAREETWMYLELCRAAGFYMGGSKALHGAFAFGRWLRKIPLLGAALPGHTQFILAVVNRIAGFGSLRRMRKAVNGVARPALAPGSFIGQRVVTGDGKINLAPADFCAQLPGLEADFERELAAGGALKLINKRERYSHNSWTHNHPDFVKGRHDRNLLNMSTSDARERTLADGQWVRLSNSQGEIRVQLAVTDDMMPGAVALCHGWGHQHMERLSVASLTAGSNVNILARDGLDSLEPISGMSQLNGILVEVRADA
ncbi:MAG: molybdopterin-dependent oxidoreductase [Haliea sp.]|nr:molybdopterin-dependent oxidoreductase [Haliea sp.]